MDPYYFNIIKLNVILLLFTAIYVCVYQMDVKQIQIVGRRELVITTHPSQIGMISFWIVVHLFSVSNSLSEILDKIKTTVLEMNIDWSDQIQLIVLIAMIFDGLGLYSSLQSHGRGKHQQTGEKSKQFIYLRIKTINKVFQESLNGDMKEMIKFTYELKCFKDALDIRVNIR